MKFEVLRVWRELRKDYVEIEADCPEKALEIASDWDASPLTDGKWLETEDVTLSTHHEGILYDSEA